MVGPMLKATFSKIMSPSNGTKIVKLIFTVLPTSTPWGHPGAGATHGAFMIRFGIHTGTVALVFHLAGILGIHGIAGVTGIHGPVGIRGVMVIHMDIPLIHPMDMVGAGGIIGSKTITISPTPQTIIKNAHYGTMDLVRLGLAVPHAPVAEVQSMGDYLLRVDKQI